MPPVQIHHCAKMPNEVGGPSQLIFFNLFFFQGSPPHSHGPQGHGSPQKKVRTFSCSSQSETEAEPEVQSQDEVLMKRPPPVHRIAVLNEVVARYVLD